MNPDVFRLAAQRLVDHDDHYACLAIVHAERELHKTPVILYDVSPYVDFFREIFLNVDGFKTFYSMYCELEPDDTPWNSERQTDEIRVLACLLAAEMVEQDETSIILRFKVSIMRVWQRITNFWKKYMVK